MQHDRYKDRDVPIDFQPSVDFTTLDSSRHHLIFLTSGSLNAELNQRPVRLKAPTILFLAPHDHWQVTGQHHPVGQGFSFLTAFLKTVPYSKYQEYQIKAPQMMNGLTLFNSHDSRYKVFTVNRQLFQKLHRSFFILGTEVFAQSDALWVCRIKKYLIQILKVLEDLSRDHQDSSVDHVLDYIFANYDQKITLADLVTVAHLNRVTLNQMFNERVGCTAMAYLTRYRLEVADELLIHTGMSLADIAESIGYEYDTYFIKQFKKQRGQSPTEFRLSSRQLATII